MAPDQTAYGREIVRDVGLLLLAGWLVVRPQSRLSLEPVRVSARPPSPTGPGPGAGPTGRWSRRRPAVGSRRILVVVLVAFVVLLVGGGIGFQAWRTNRSPTAAPAAAPVAGAPATITDARPIVFGTRGPRSP